MDLSPFYAAFSPACFALLGLWVVAVQIRLDQWQADRGRKRRAYGVALYFALPGIMSVFALIDTKTPTFWRVSFGTVAFGGVLVMAAVHAWPVPVERDGTGRRRLPFADRLGVAAFAAGVGLYLAIGALALAGGAPELRTEGVLLTVLVFLGFNVAWLLLFEDLPAPAAKPAEETEVVAITEMAVISVADNLQREG